MRARIAGASSPEKTRQEARADSGRRGCEDGAWYKRRGRPRALGRCADPAKPRPPNPYGKAAVLQCGDGRPTAVIPPAVARDGRAVCLFDEAGSLNDVAVRVLDERGTTTAQFALRGACPLSSIGHDLFEIMLFVASDGGGLLRRALTSFI